jgi:uncharacterized protein (DUF885 family)
LLRRLSLFAAAIALIAAPATAQDSPGRQLAGLIDRAGAVSVGTRSAAEYGAAAETYREILEAAAELPLGDLSLDDQVDLELLRGQLTTRIFEYAEIELFRVNPAGYFALGSTNRLFIRPGAIPDSGVRRAVEELQRLPTILRNAAANLTRPARVWTENALYQAYYARLLLTDYLPEAEVDSAELRDELLDAGRDALRAVERYERFLREELLPRSDRSPSWRPEDIEVYQFAHEQLYDYGVDEMLRIAAADEERTMAEMVELAKEIHPSGDLRTVWEVMKSEAPPWAGVLPMAQRFVDLASDWLRNEGSHVVTIPDYIDYGARITPPMARRTLSFGGATGGPTVAGRQSGYYILTPLEERLTEAEKASRIKSYNPYWTHVISYHEWLGHNVQIAAANANVSRPMRRAFRSIYHSQAWSFYLEKLLEDEGYFEDRLDYTSALKTRMARLQMRMWRIQRILTKLRMAKDDMTFDQAVQAYVDSIGMEPTNAFIEVQRDSQTPSPPAREIIGERELLRLRDEYARRMGPHYTLKRFNDTFISYGDLPFRQIRRLMFRD